MVPHLVATHFHIPELREILVAIVKLADEWLESLVGELMGSDVATLGEATTTLVARVWSLTGVTAHVSLAGSATWRRLSSRITYLQVPVLRESKFAAWKFTHL